MRANEGGTYILCAEDQERAAGRTAYPKAGIFIHLYYPDTLDRYFAYIRRIPRELAVFISVSREDTGAGVSDRIRAYRLSNCRVVQKDNRGRDISALLVAFREEILNYEYICFLHDKKSRYMDEEDCESWVTDMWENMLCSEGYIRSVLEFFRKNAEVGLLVPPEPLSEQFSILADTWGANLGRTQALARELGLSCGPDGAESPRSLGTVFWCRVDGLRKLLLKNWTYEDFPEEPLPADGTVSHAVERIFSYAAADAGYASGCVMTRECAQRRLEYAQRLLAGAFHIAEDCAGICRAQDLLHFEDKREQLRVFCQAHPPVYIYGAGKMGRRAFRFLASQKIGPAAFLVSGGQKREERLLGLPVRELSEEMPDRESGIIVAAGRDSRPDILSVLRESGYRHILCF